MHDWAFDSLVDFRTGLMNGEKAFGVLSKSGLPFEDLGQIWAW